MNILDYLATEFASFDEKPLNPVDSAALSQFCMVRMEDIAPMKRVWSEPPSLRAAVADRLRPVRPVRFTDALRAEHYDSLFTGLVPEPVKNNMLALAASPRFRTMTVQDCASVFDEATQTQFAAMTFVCRKKFAYVGFRGTDRSFTGWRENFNMTYQFPVPAQDLAVRYLEAVAPRLPQRLYLGGHSKGGNLAEYAALHATPKVQERIERIYDHDGPGFRAGAVDDRAFSIIRDRVHKTVPQECIVGMLLETPRELPLHVVRSADHGMMQHSVLNWEVKGTDFVYADQLADSSLSTHAIMEQWLTGFSPEKTRQVVEAAFRAIEASSALDAADILMGGVKSIALLVEAAKALDQANRDILVSALGTLTNLIAHDAARGVAGWLAPKTKGAS